MKKKGFLWLLVFIFIILLSQDYLFVDWELKSSLFGFPQWIFYFILIHILFIVAYALFMKHFWKE